MIGLSGGVDSAVTALLLQQQGYQVSGLFMKNWQEDSEFCPATEDKLDAQNICDILKIPFYTVNFAAEYWENVFKYFLEEYQQGRTPNPDILCNREIKFKVFLDQALSLGADGIATGHYAAVKEDNEGFHLYQAQDQNKDQTYFLHAIHQKALSYTLFPLGELEKPLVRQLAAQAGFLNSAKKDSTGICFIGERPFKEFLSQFLPAQPGVIETVEGKVIGQHDGLMYYTLGQRQGLKIGGTQGSSGEPWYVVEKNLPRNLLIVGPGVNHPLLFKQSLVASKPNWIIGKPPKLPLSVKAKIRYRQKEQPCTIIDLGNQQLSVVFDEPQRAMTPGQSVVFYQGKECLGGAVIDQTFS